MGDVVVEQRKWNVLVSVVSPYEVHGNSKDRQQQDATRMVFGGEWGKRTMFNATKEIVPIRYYQEAMMTLRGDARTKGSRGAHTTNKRSGYEKYQYCVGRQRVEQKRREQRSMRCKECGQRVCACGRVCSNAYCYKCPMDPSKPKSRTKGDARV